MPIACDRTAHALARARRGARALDPETPRPPRECRADAARLHAEPTIGSMRAECGVRLRYSCPVAGSRRSGMQSDVPVSNHIIASRVTLRAVAAVSGYGDWIVAPVVFRGRVIFATR